MLNKEIREIQAVYESMIFEASEYTIRKTGQEKTKTQYYDDRGNPTKSINMYYDIFRNKVKVGELINSTDTYHPTDLTGTMFGKELPNLSSYQGYDPSAQLQSFVKSKTGQKFIEKYAK